MFVYAYVFLYVCVCAYVCTYVRFVRFACMCVLYVCVLCVDFFTGEFCIHLYRYVYFDIFSNISNCRIQHSITTSIYF